MLASATTVVVWAGSKPSSKSTRRTEVSVMPAFTSGTSTSSHSTSEPSIEAGASPSSVVVRKEGSQSSSEVSVTRCSMLAPSPSNSVCGCGYELTTTRATPSTTRVSTCWPSISVVSTISGAERSDTSISWMTVPAWNGAGSVGIGRGSTGTGSIETGSSPGATGSTEPMAISAPVAATSSTSGTGPPMKPPPSPDRASRRSPCSRSCAPQVASGVRLRTSAVAPSRITSSCWSTT